MQYYFFNVTNAQAVMQGGKPTVEEIGPYTYREYRPRENVTFLENGTKVSALSPKTFVFRRDMSSGDPEVDLITTVNIPAVNPFFINIYLIYRSIYLTFEKDVGIKGIPAYRFSPPPEVLASPEINPANAGFCVPAGTCMGTGVLKVNVCRKGAPVVVSFPHFYQADQKYVDAIEGLSPNKDDHETYLDINPSFVIDDASAKRLAQAPVQSNQLINTASALSAPTLLGDERDAIFAKWNQLQAFWGTGKGYFNNSIPPVDFTQENPFCRFKAVGFSCIPGSKDEDGLVILAFNRKEDDIRNLQQQLVEALHKVLGGNQTLTVNVEGVKALPDNQTEVLIYVVERSPNGTSKRIPATTLFNYFEQANIKNQLLQLGVVRTLTRTELSPAQLKQLLQNPPAGVDPIIWEQAKVDNPDAEKTTKKIKDPRADDKAAPDQNGCKCPPYSFSGTLFICVFRSMDIISEDISELQKNQATTVAKIAQYRRKLMDLSHRVLQVLIKQEIQRKSGYAIQVDEEHLRVQLDTIQSELNAPTQFKGRLNELMSQIRMQNHFGAARSEERYSVDADLLREIKQHLKQQQEGLSHLISVVKDDVEDIKLIEHGLHDSVHTRGGSFS
ncbi:UNVERIFIED_CONTAM: hypothetical protein FKN15_047307 [Acipenser sinensis]